MVKSNSIESNKNVLKLDKSEILKFIKLDEVVKSTVESLAEQEDKIFEDEDDILQIIELLSISREFGLLIGDIEEYIEYSLESCKYFTRKIDEILCGINRIKEDRNWNQLSQIILFSFSSKLLNLKSNINLLMEKIVLSQ